MDITERLEPSRWYSAQEVATQLAKTLLEVQAVYDTLMARSAARGRPAIAYYQGPNTPLIQGGALMQALYGVAYAV